MKQDEALRQRARAERKLATLARAEDLVKTGLSRLEALTQAVTEHRDTQNKKYSESGKHV